jgi:hypothetical protein
MVALFQKSVVAKPQLRHTSIPVTISMDGNGERDVGISTARSWRRWSSLRRRARQCTVECDVSLERGAWTSRSARMGGDGP